MQKKQVEIGYGKIKKLKIGEKLPLVFIGGPCAIESRDHAFKMADSINNICKKVGIEWIYKSCYDKDCRSSSSSFLGLGIDKGLKILSEIRDEFGISVVSTVFFFCGVSLSSTGVFGTANSYFFKPSGGLCKNFPSS